MKQILVPHLKKWLLYGLIGVVAYCAGYFIGNFYLDVKKPQKIESHGTETHGTENQGQDTLAPDIRNPEIPKVEASTKL